MRKSGNSFRPNGEKELDRRIHTLVALRDELDGCIGCGCLSRSDCPLRNPGDRLGEEGTGARLLEDEQTKAPQGRFSLFSVFVFLSIPLVHRRVSPTSTHLIRARGGGSGWC